MVLELLPTLALFPRCDSMTQKRQALEIKRHLQQRQSQMREASVWGLFY